VERNSLHLVAGRVNGYTELTFIESSAVDSLRLRQIRLELGISTDQMAKLVGLDEPETITLLNAFESGELAIPGPVSRVLEYLSQATPTDEDALSNDVVWQMLPRFLDCTDLENPRNQTVAVFHVRWPRFISWFVRGLPESMMESMSVGGVPILETDHSYGIGSFMVTLFVDKPIHDPMPLLYELLMLKQRHYAARHRFL
jgi:transcriptional regulator with XRE-family HTH domain